MYGFNIGGKCLDTDCVPVLPGIVSCDPEIPVDQTLIPSPPTRPKNPVFEDEEKSKVGCARIAVSHGFTLPQCNKETLRRLLVLTFPYISFL